jgi:hypothetical protein
MRETEKAINAIKLETKVRSLIHSIGPENCILPDGRLNPYFILTHIFKTSKEACVENKKLHAAVEELNKRNVFKNLYPKVSDTALSRYVFTHEALVRPSQVIEGRVTSAMLTGVILKLPVNNLNSNNFPGDEWKALLHPENEFSVGDTVLYTNRTSIVIERETLHLVGYFTGKILNK